MKHATAPASTSQPTTQDKKTYLMSYAYDVPHYADFTIQADSKEEAIAIAQAALDNGKFDNVVGEPCFDNLDGHRVFCERESEPGDVDHIDAMADFKGFDDNANAARNGITLQPAPPKTPDSVTAAAPDLLAALQKCLATLIRTNATRPYSNSVDTAIKHAKTAITQATKGA